MISLLLLAVQQHTGPTGEVNDVCWKLLGIAGTGFVVLSGVIVVLAKKLWESANNRLADKEKIFAALLSDKEKRGG